jgi:hypothetical protein
VLAIDAIAGAHPRASVEAALHAKKVLQPHLAKHPNIGRKNGIKHAQVGSFSGREERLAKIVDVRRNAEPAAFPFQRKCNRRQDDQDEGYDS